MRLNGVLGQIDEAVAPAAGHGREYRDGIFSTSTPKYSGGAMLESYADGVLGQMDEAMAPAAGQGREYRDGIFSTSTPKYNGGTMLETYADGVLGDSLAPFPMMGEGRAFQAGVFGKGYPAAPYGSELKAFADGVLGNAGITTLEPPPPGTAYRGGIMQTPFAMRSARDGVLGQNERATTIGYALYAASIAGSVVGAYHGYKRNRGSVGWAIVWSLLGGAFWPIAVPVMVAQGVGKPK